MQTALITGGSKGFGLALAESLVADGWSVVIQGSAHHVDSDAERAAAGESDVQPWSGGVKEHYMRVVPTRITGRRIHAAH